MNLDQLIKRTIVQDFIAQTCLALNANKWNEFLEQCDSENFFYTIENYSPEIKKQQCWMRQNYDGLKHLINLLPKHNSDHAQLTRHITTYAVSQSNDRDIYETNTQFAIYRTEWDSDNSHIKSGSTSLFVIGRYLDRIKLTSAGGRLIKRCVELETRQVGIGSHFIL